MSKYKQPFQPDLMAFPLGWGGKRDNAGRKPAKKSVVVLIPADLLILVTEIKNHHEEGHLITVTFKNPKGQGVTL